MNLNNRALIKAPRKTTLSVFFSEVVRLQPLTINSINQHTFHIHTAATVSKSSLEGEFFLQTQNLWQYTNRHAENKSLKNLTVVIPTHKASLNLCVCVFQYEEDGNGNEEDVKEVTKNKFLFINIVINVDNILNVTRVG